jgi:hypothetical protein
MKALFSICTLVLLCTTAASAQSDKYAATMKKNIAEIDSAVAKNTIANLANNFERIATAEKTQWLAYYYAAYCQVMTAFLQKDKTLTDGIADKAEVLIKKAEELAGAENAETCVIKSMIASAHMMVDPQKRWMQYGEASSSNIVKAKQMDSTNPRPVYLEGQAAFYTPEAFGGGKLKAKPLFEKAIAMFPGFKAATELSPTWGKASATYFLGLCK